MIPASSPPSVEAYIRLRETLSAPLPADFNIAKNTCSRWAASSRTALLVPGTDGVRSYSFSEISLAAQRLANALRAEGVGTGDRVAVILGQSFECAVSHIAIQMLGAIAVPLTTLYGPEALEHRLAVADPRVAIGAWDSHGWLPDHDLKGACTWVMVGDARTGFTPFADLLAAGAAGFEPAGTRITDPAIMIFTSGTTGLAKGVLHAQRVVPAHTEPISLAHNGFPKGDDVFWSPADWAWAGGLIDCLFGAWSAGRPIVAWRSRGFDPEAVVDLMAGCHVTNTFLPPTALRLLREAAEGKATLDRLELRSVMTGGERVGEDIVDWCREALNLTPNEVFGQTEASCILGNSSTVLPPRSGSIGMEYPRARIAILGDDGREVGTGEIGEIAVHEATPALFLGYWSAGVLTPREGEWHLTGDRGARDADGYFWHHGRKDDVILSAGYRIGPGEIEETLSRHPAVRMVAVVGTPDAIRGELVTAVMELRDGYLDTDALRDELQALVRTELAPYEVPKRMHFRDQLPRTETGKVKRSEIKSQLGLEASTE